MARTATVTRNTRETQITLTINLDGTGKADLHTGIGFFDHMLDGFARHGLFDLSVTCHGDLDVDCHHTIEDIGIALAAIILFCWQGAIYLLAGLIAPFITDTLMTEISLVGGVLIFASGLGILGIKKIKTLNLLPALLIPPVAVTILSHFGI